MKRCFLRNSFSLEAKSLGIFVKMSKCILTIHIYSPTSFNTSSNLFPSFISAEKQSPDFFSKIIFLRFRIFGFSFLIWIFVFLNSEKLKREWIGISKILFWILFTTPKILDTIKLFSSSFPTISSRLEPVVIISSIKRTF